MHYLIASCPCGQRLKVASTVESARCPKCQTLLRIKQPEKASQPPASKSTTLGKASTGESIPPKSIPLQLRCPCGQIVGLPAGSSVTTCGHCGTTIRAANRSAGKSTDPTPSNGPTPNRADSLASTLPPSRRAETDQAAAFRAALDTTVDATPRATTSPARPANPKARPRSSKKETTSTVAIPAWLIPVSIGVGSLAVLGIIAGLVFPRFLKEGDVPQGGLASASSNPSDQPTASIEDTPNLSGTIPPQADDSRWIRIGTYPPGPRLPGTTEFLERDFVEGLPEPISEFVKDVPPQLNAAPLYLEALKPLTDDLAVCFPEDQRSELIRVGQQNKKLIEDWYEQYRTQGVTRGPAELKAFDSVLAGLAAAQQRPQCSYLFVPQLDTAMPEVQVIRVLIRLSILRCAALSETESAQSAIDELRVTLRYLREVGHHAAMGQFSSLSGEQFLLENELPILLEHRYRTASNARLLLDTLDEHASAAGVDRMIESIRTEKLLFHRLVYQMKRDPNAVSQLLDATSISRPLTEAENQRRQLLLVHLSSMTEAQLDLNKKARDEDDKQVLEFLTTDHNDWAAPSKKLGESLAERFKILNERSKKAFEQGDLNSVPWLHALIYTDHQASLRQYIAIVAWRRVAIAQVAADLWGATHSAAPPDVATVLEEAKVKSTATDPYTGQPLKLVIRDGRPIVYSVGNDLRDDFAASLSVSAASPGDIYVPSKTP